MNNKENLTLIEGSFSVEEAKEILTSIFSSKINFHKIRNLSSQVRYGTDDEIAQKRIPALKTEMEKLQLIIAEAKAHNKKLMVSSEISIVLVDE
jgi:D-mannonate dehydratase